MTFDELKKRVGKNIKYYDDTNGWLTSKDVTETDIGDYINEVYTEEMFPLFSRRWPNLFRQVGTLNSHIMNATIASVSTTTLVINTDTDSQFANSMEGLNVYNEDQDEVIAIETYTSISTVTMESTVAGWDADDTIYVLGQEFAFGGDATDFYSIERIGIKYTSDDTFYKTANLRDKQDLMRNGDDESYYSKDAPYAYLTSILDSGTMYNAIGIFPKFDEKLSNAIEIDYIAKPSAITGDGSTPIIPIQESIITGATMKAYEKMQDHEVASYWMRKYEMAQRKDISRYMPQTSNKPTRIAINRNAYAIHRRLR